MGRNTFESIGKPLDNRYNIVVTSKNIPDVMTTPSLDSALTLRDTICDKNIETYVIGGEQLYKNALNHNLLSSVIASEINNNYDCDTFFPKLPNTFRKTDTIYTDNEMKIVKYEDISTDNSSEYLYLDLLKDVLENGYISNSRSGKVSSTFTKQLIHDIELINNDNNENNEKNIYRFPMITTKRLFFRRVFEELMWMLRGQTDSTILSKQGNHIWDGNTSRESLDNIGLIDYKEGELGPGYGAQLIHWGGNQNFINGSLNMEGGINQIKYVIDELRNNIFSRRAMINLWNPTDLNKMALPP
jgi:dihydrofolate reductase